MELIGIQTEGHSTMLISWTSISDFNGYSKPRRHYMSAAREKEVAVAANNCDCNLGGASGRGKSGSLMSVADFSFGEIKIVDGVWKNNPTWYFDY